MKKKVVKQLVGILGAVSLIFINTKVYAITLNEMLEEKRYSLGTEVEYQIDPINLINRGILKGLSIEDIKYDGQTIINALNEEQLNQYEFSSSTVKYYKDNIDKAKNALQNGWTAKDVILYANEAYEIYEKYIGDTITDSTTAEEITTDIQDYIKRYVEGNFDIGDINGTLPSILSDYKLEGITAKVDNEGLKTYSILSNENEEKYHCTETVWYTEGQSFKALFSGKITQITTDSITVTTGNEDKALKTIYTNPAGMTTSLIVGNTVKQGEALFIPNYQTNIKLTYNDYNIDLLQIMGPTSKILVSEYKRMCIVEYNEIREEYIKQLMNTQLH